MIDESFLTEFRKRRKLLNNLRPITATPRLGEMWNFLNQSPETFHIIHSLPSVDNLIKEGKAKDAKTVEEIASVGLYILKKCAQGKEHITQIVHDLGIGVTQPKATQQSYTNDAAEFVNIALDYLEDRIKQSVEMPDEPEADRPKKSRAYSEDEKKCIRIVAAWFREHRRFVNSIEAKEAFGVDGDEFETLVRKLDRDEIFRIAKRDSMGNGFAELFHPLQRADELARKFDEENRSKRRKLQNGFIEFLKNDEKGYPSETIWIQGEGGKEVSLWVIGLTDEKPIALIDFAESNDIKVIGLAAAILIKYRNSYHSENCPAFLVCPSSGNSAEPFEILEVSGNGYESISINDFPTYAELTKEPPKADVSGGGEKEGTEDKQAVDNGELELRNRVFEFLKTKKKWPKEFLVWEGDKSDHGIDIEIRDPKSDNLFALIELKYPRQSGKIRKSANQVFRYQQDNGLKAVDAYVICPATVKSGDKFEVHGVSEHGEPIDMKKDDLPSYENYPLDRKEVGATEQIESHFGVDNTGKNLTVKGGKEAEEDLLGRDQLINAFANLITNTKVEEVKGLTIALLGDWGEGKSSVMTLLEKGLKESNDSSFVFAKFNAWKYEHTDNIAAALAQEVVGGMVKRFDLYDQLLLGWRFAREEYRTDIIKTSLSLIFIALLVTTLYGVDKPIVNIGATAGLGWAIYESVKKFNIFAHPLATKLDTFLRLPNYGKHLGLLSVLKRHIKTLADLTLGEDKFLKCTPEKDFRGAKYKDIFELKPQEKKRFILFVDDLDRCQPECIAKTLDAIRLVMDIENVIVMIGIDHRIAFKAIEKHYEELADGSGNRSAAEIARDYLAKIIQLPVRLVASNKAELKRFVNKGLFLNAVERIKSEPEKTSTENSGLQSGSTGSGQGDNDKAVAEQPKDYGPEVVETIVERDKFYDLAVMYEYTNPRQLLRLRNSYRFLKVLNRRKHDEDLIMQMLFWQEFLHNWPMKDRGRCMAALIDDKEIEKAKPEARGVLKKVTGDVSKLFNDKSKGYEELAKFVRVVVLPHNEEGVLDSRKEINDWMTEEEGKRKEKEGEAND